MRSMIYIRPSISLLYVARVFYVPQRPLAFPPCMHCPCPTSPFIVPSTPHSGQTHRSCTGNARVRVLGPGSVPNIQPWANHQSPLPSITQFSCMHSFDLTFFVEPYLSCCMHVGITAPNKLWILHCIRGGLPAFDCAAILCIDCVIQLDFFVQLQLHRQGFCIRGLCGISLAGIDLNGTCQGTE